MVKREHAVESVACTLSFGSLGEHGNKDIFISMFPRSPG